VTRDQLLLAAGIVVLTAVTFVRFPGHTILQSDTQIYIPILEHLWDPSVLVNDPMASRPHVVYTVYDEVALVLRKVTGLGFEHVLTAQQFVYRALAMLGLWLIARAAGLSYALAFLAAAIPMLGAVVSGPSVLTVEYEPVPRGFALSFILLSLGAAATNHWRAASVAASIAFLFHPPTAFFYCWLLAAVAVWQRQVRALLPFVVCGVLFLLLVFVPERPAEGQEILTRIDPALEAMQRPRAAYNWVSMWWSTWIPQYLALAVFCGVVIWQAPRVLSVLFAALAACGLLSIAVSWFTIEYGKWMLGVQFQPGRYLLWVPLTAAVLGAVVGIREASRGRYVRATLLLTVCFALPLQPELRAITVAPIGISVALAVLVTVAVRWPVAAAAVAFVPFLLMPASSPPVHSAELDELARWARESTPKDAVFLFADAGPGLEPGVFRARALRALYMDWKSGGQINFLRSFAAIWGQRWPQLRRVRPLGYYRSLAIDYLVFRRENLPKGGEQVWENSRYVVVRNRPVPSAHRPAG
jgi:hypothetical protein